MKKISVCVNCERELYTNNLDLCKRCHQEVGFEFLKKQEPEEVIEDEPVSIEDLGIEEEDIEDEGEETEEPAEVKEE